MPLIIKIAPWVLLLLLVAVWVPWRTIFEKIFGNNPYKARVYVEAGEEIKICMGRYFSDSPRGVVYSYKYQGIRQKIIVPSDYPYKFILGTRQIRAIIGNPVAQPLGGYQPSRLTLGPADLNKVFEAHIAADLAKTIFGKAVNIMAILIIIGALVLAGVFFYKQMQVGGMFYHEPAAQTAPVQPEQPALQPSGPLG